MRRALPNASQVRRLHEILCFLRAYPDNSVLLARVEMMLASFARRADLAAHRESLADSGIAGTPIRFRFFAPAALWLARRWGARITIEWDRFENRELLERWIPLLALYSETPGIDEYAYDAREWIELMKGPGETDAAFLARRIAALPAGPFVREKLYDELDPPLRLEPGPDTPSRTAARHVPMPVVFQTGPLARSRPDLREEILRPPVSVRAASPREAGRLIDLAREAMVTRERDLDVFSYGNPRDVRLVDCGGGLQFACIGMLPERRLLLESVYGFLTLRNGVPIGYVLSGSLFRSAEVAYNVFDTFRGAEAAAVYARVLAMMRHLFGADTFTIDPYQLGRGNPEALLSGAWWFYQKLGFRPRDRATLRLMNGEESTDAQEPGPPVEPPGPRAACLHEPLLVLRPAAGRCPGEPLPAGRRAEDHALSRAAVRSGPGGRAEVVPGRGGPPRRAARRCAGFTRDEREAWARWSPLILILPGLESWSAAERRALVEVVRAKGGPRESDFIARFDRHPKLMRAVASPCPGERRLKRGAPDPSRRDAPAGG